MENTRNNNLWIVVVVAVVAAMLVGMCACAFGLAVGMAIGQARTWSLIPEPDALEPEMPEMPVSPAPQVLPDIPGMPGMPMPDEMMEFMGGAMVSEVVAGGPADQAGIEAGDMILAVNGDQISQDLSLADLIGAYGPGDEITLTIVRMSQGAMSEEEVVVVLGANPDDPSLGFLGVRFVPMFPIEEFDTP